jgi:hypothetical protein
MNISIKIEEFKSPTPAIDYDKIARNVLDEMFSSETQRKIADQTSDTALMDYYQGRMSQEESNYFGYRVLCSILGYSKKEVFFSKLSFVKEVNTTTNELLGKY